MFLRALAAPVIIAAGGLIACSEVAEPPVTERPEGVSTTASNHLVFDCAAQSSVPVAECEALVALYASTAGDGWTNNTGWLTAADPCTWFGVQCLGGSVIQIFLASNNLVGMLPTELGNLGNLLLLSLVNNDLSGSIPAEIGALGSLTSLDLRANELSGSIPPQLGGLGSLTFFGLSTNQLTGSIPPELGSLSSLESLGLDSNQLTGAIPAQLGNLSSLEGLSLRSNQLTGPIPPELGALANLTALDIAFNSLTGAIPAQLGNLIDLELLRLGFNQLSGPIPAELGSLTNLVELDSFGNFLGGQVPLGVAEIGGAITRALRCRLNGNTGLFMPDIQPYRDADLDGDGFICGIELGADTDGDGIPDAIDPDPIADALELIADAAFKSPGAGHRNAMQSRLADIEQDIADGDIAQAIRALENLKRKVDGCGTTAERDDWIVDCAAQIAVRDLIDTLIAGLGG